MIFALKVIFVFFAIIGAGVVLEWLLDRYLPYQKDDGHS